MADLWMPAVVNHNFEQQTNIFMGEIDVDKFRYPIRSSRFVIHEKCSQFSLCPKCIRFDLGYIILEEDVSTQPGVLFGTWGKLDYAGPYHQEQMEDIYDRVLGQSHVCLTVGFGVNEKGVVSQHMRQAWIRLLNWEQCRQAMYLGWGTQRFYKYSDSSTWICAQKLDGLRNSKLIGRHAEGDSGSPITCSDNYVALVTGHIVFKKLRVGFTEMMLETAIKFGDGNAVDKRLIWEHEMFRGPQTDFLRILRLPSGKLLKHPGLKYPELKKGSLSLSSLRKNPHK